MSHRISLSEFTDAYRNSHGEEGALQLLMETLNRLGIEKKTEFSKEEARSICKDLQNKTGFVGIVAGILLSRFGQA